MLGPVFTLELMRERRRGLYWHLLPWAYAALLGFQMVIAWHEAFVADRFLGHLPSPAVVFPAKFHQFIALHFLALLLITPALTASALGHEKARGTLADLFTTALTCEEILLGKLAARSLRVVEMMLPSLPILFVVGGYAGVPLRVLAALALLSVLVVIGVGAGGLLCAVESKHSSGALVAAYALLGAGWLAVRLVPVPALDPLEALAGTWDAADPWGVAAALGGAALAWLAVAGGSFAVAVWRLRPVGLRQMEEDGPKRSAVALSRPPIGDDPIRWKEHHIDGLALLSILRRVNRTAGLCFVGLLALGLTLGSSMRSLSRSGNSADPFPFIVQGLFFLLAATLIVTVRAAGAVTGERDRDTWDSLRLTPLDGRTFLKSKLRGIFDGVIPYYLAYALPALVVCPTFLTVTGGPVGMLATIASLLIVWPLMYYAATSGLRASVLARSTWRAVVAALFAVYGTAFFLWAFGFGCMVVLMAWRPIGVVACPVVAALVLVLIGRLRMSNVEARALDPPPSPVSLGKRPRKVPIEG